MKWTKQHSQNAVRAKERKRMTPPPPEQLAGIRRSVRHVKARRAKAKWTLTLTDEQHGGGFKLKLYRLPWPARFVDSGGREWSASKLGQMVKIVFTQSA